MVKIATGSATRGTLGEFTVKTQGPGMMNKDQESEMQSIEENSLQFHQQNSALTLSMEFVGRSAYMF